LSCAARSAIFGIWRKSMMWTCVPLLTWWVSAVLKKRWSCAVGT